MKQIKLAETRVDIQSPTYLHGRPCGSPSLIENRLFRQNPSVHRDPQREQEFSADHILRECIRLECRTLILNSSFFQVHHMPCVASSQPRRPQVRWWYSGEHSCLPSDSPQISIMGHDDVTIKDKDSSWLCSNSGPATCQLCGVKQVTYPLYSSPSLFIKWEQEYLSYRIVVRMN